MRKPELAAAIAEKADLTKDQANRVLNAVLEEITGALNRKDSVTLVGFGTFVQRHRGARTGKNPQTGAPDSAGMGKTLQGFLEGSNVNVVEELVTMIQTQRAYEMNSKAIQTSDQMLAKLSQM